jgi:hypothetical protein
MHATLFCDESGNTGPEYCNEEQPIFVAAGFLIADEHADTCRQLVVTDLADLNRIRQTPVGELKSTLLLRSGPGRRRAATLLEGLIHAGAVPVLCAMDKHFSLGGRFVDDYLDLADNPRAGPEYCTDRELRRAAATAIGELAIETLRAVELALREPTLANRRSAVRLVVDALRLRGSLDLAYIAEGALIDVSGPAFTTSQSDLSSPDIVRTSTPNVAAFGALLVGADILARQWKVTTTKLIHDETPGFRSTIEHSHWFHSSAHAHDQMARVPHTVMFERVQTIEAPQFVSSISEPLVQAADILAGCTLDFIRRFRRDEKLDAAAWRFAQIGMKAFAHGPVPASGLVFSDNKQWLIDLIGGLDVQLQREITERFGLPRRRNRS